MKIDRAGWPFVLGALGPVLAFALILPWLAALFVAVALFMLYFFRDPERVVPAEDGLVVAPADGRVLVAGDAERSGSARVLETDQHLPVAPRRAHQPRSD